MSIETLSFILLALGILGSHLATLRLLMDCKRDLSVSATDFNGSISAMNEAMMEVIRIGSDVADQMDSIAAGAGVASVPTLSPKVDLQTTIMSLIADKVIGGLDGNKTQSERTIYEENSTTPESISSE
jgi:hypothetical protein